MSTQSEQVTYHGDPMVPRLDLHEFIIYGILYVCVCDHWLQQPVDQSFYCSPLTHPPPIIFSSLWSLKQPGVGSRATTLSSQPVSHIST